MAAPLLFGAGGWPAEETGAELSATIGVPVSVWLVIPLAGPKERGKRTRHSKAKPQPNLRHRDTEAQSLKRNDPLCISAPLR